MEHFDVWGKNQIVTGKVQDRLLAPKLTRGSQPPKCFQYEVHSPEGGKVYQQLCSLNLIHVKGQWWTGWWNPGVLLAWVSVAQGARREHRSKACNPSVRGIPVLQENIWSAWWISRSLVAHGHTCCSVSQLASRLLKRMTRTQLSVDELLLHSTNSYIGGIRHNASGRIRHGVDK